MSERKKKRVTASEWEVAIRKARQFVVNYDKTRWLIADLALSVCDYAHGGRKGEGVYSLSKFADEIEVDRKTLYEWIRIKRTVFDKLPKTIQTSAHTFLYENFTAVAEVVSSEASPKEVFSAWQSALERNPETTKFRKYLKKARSILYNAQRPMLMKDVEAEVIVEMISILDASASLLRKEMELRRKFSSEDRANAARLNIKEELAERIVGASK